MHAYVLLLLLLLLLLLPLLLLLLQQSVWGLPRVLDIAAVVVVVGAAA